MWELFLSNRHIIRRKLTTIVPLREDRETQCEELHTPVLDCIPEISVQNNKMFKFRQQKLDLDSEGAHNSTQGRVAE